MLEVSAKLLVGVDGGQTSSRCLVSDLSGRVIGYSQGGPSDHLNDRRSFNKLRQTLMAMFSQALPSKLRHHSIALCLGLTGVGFSKDRLHKKVAKCAEEILNQCGFTVERCYVCNDMVIAWAGAALLEPGVLVYAGTGAHVYAVSGDGRVARVGGWGYIIDDEGGAYDIARQALKRVFRAEDGRAKPTMLKKLFLEYFGCSDLSELRHIIYYKGGLPKSERPKPASLVSHAAESGDEVAQVILKHAGETLAEMAITAIKKLNLQDSVMVYPAGGVFNAGRWILQPFMETLEAEIPWATIIMPHLPPVAGAILIAAQASGLKINAEFIQHLKVGVDNLKIC